MITPKAVGGAGLITQCVYPLLLQEKEGKKNEYHYRCGDFGQGRLYD